MELSLENNNTLKISTKNGTVVINPTSSATGNILILSDNTSPSFDVPDSTLVIYGPGEYEASGILVKGTRPQTDTVYEISDANGKILYTTSNSISKLTDEEDFDAVVVRVVDSYDEAVLEALSANLLVIFGDSSQIPDEVKQNKIAKINLKKKDQLESKIVFLESR